MGKDLATLRCSASEVARIGKQVALSNLTSSTGVAARRARHGAEPAFRQKLYFADIRASIASPLERTVLGTAGGRIAQIADINNKDEHVLTCCRTGA